MLPSDVAKLRPLPERVNIPDMSDRGSSGCDRTTSIKGSAPSFFFADRTLNSPVPGIVTAEETVFPNPDEWASKTILTLVSLVERGTGEQVNSKMPGSEQALRLIFATPASPSAKSIPAASSSERLSLNIRRPQTAASDGLCFNILTLSTTTEALFGATLKLNSNVLRDGFPISKILSRANLPRYSRPCLSCPSEGTNSIIFEPTQRASPLSEGLKLKRPSVGTEVSGVEANSIFTEEDSEISPPV